MENHILENISSSVIVPTEEQQYALEVVEEMSERFNELDHFMFDTVHNDRVYLSPELAWFIADLSIMIRLNKEKIQNLLNEEYKNFNF